VKCRVKPLGLCSYILCKELRKLHHLALKAWLILVSTTYSGSSQQSITLTYSFDQTMFATKPNTYEGNIVDLAPARFLLGDKREVARCGIEYYARFG